MTAQVVEISRARLRAMMSGRRSFGDVYPLNTSEVPRCPGCFGQNWWIGRRSAECAFCSSALQLAGDRVLRFER